jgi:hypothetical protein
MLTLSRRTVKRLSRPRLACMPCLPCRCQRRPLPQMIGKSRKRCGPGVSCLQTRPFRCLSKNARRRAQTGNQYHSHNALSEHHCGAGQGLVRRQKSKATIFRSENGSYKLVGRVQMDEWPRIAAAHK